MLRLVALAAAVVVSTASPSVHAASIETDGAVARTAKAVRKAVKRRKLDGNTWLGKLRGVGGHRDTLIYVPAVLDAKQPIDVVIYMEGIGSFTDSAMDATHAAAIAKLRKRNFVYVAPDAPSSSLGNRRATEEHWQAGCADTACEGGHAAPGDFLVFLDEIRTHVAQTAGASREALDLRVSLIGFSRGGKGALAALEQLEAVKFEVGGLPVRIGHVVFADGNYVDNALTRSWEILENRAEAPQLTVVVSTGELSETTGDGNRRRAFLFWNAVEHGPRLRLIQMGGGHFAIGEAAVDFLAAFEPMAHAS